MWHKIVFFCEFLRFFVVETFNDVCTAFYNRPFNSIAKVARCVTLLCLIIVCNIFFFSMFDLANENTKNQERQLKIDRLRLNLLEQRLKEHENNF